MTGPRPLRDLVGRWKPGGEPAAGGDLSALIASWSEVVGEDVARRTRPLSLRAGTLSVLTTSSEWSHHLTFLAPAIIERLDVHAGHRGIGRLRFVVATGRTRALLMRSPERSTNVVGSADAGPGIAVARSHHKSQTLRGEHESIEDLIAHLRREQEALDRARSAAGWLRCSRCGALYELHDATAQNCSLCADELQRRADDRVARALQLDPWMRWADVAEHVKDADEASFERARRRLLTLWEQQLQHAQARLRRGALESADRIAAWSYMMLRTHKPQRELRRAVVENTIGREWADALVEARARAPRK